MNGIILVLSKQWDTIVVCHFSEATSVCPLKTILFDNTKLKASSTMFLVLNSVFSKMLPNPPMHLGILFGEDTHVNEFRDQQIRLCSKSNNLMHLHFETVKLNLVQLFPKAPLYSIGCNYHRRALHFIRNLQLKDFVSPAPFSQIYYEIYDDLLLSSLTVFSRREIQVMASSITSLRFHLLCCLTAVWLLIPPSHSADPDPLQDFCVANISASISVNGFPCKPASEVTLEDFFFDGFTKEVAIPWKSLLEGSGHLPS
ncbi:hypothetical protein SCA6_003902 [Theobroma cacao]